MNEYIIKMTQPTYSTILYIIHIPIRNIYLLNSLSMKKLKEKNRGTFSKCLGVCICILP